MACGLAQQLQINLLQRTPVDVTSRLGKEAVKPINPLSQNGLMLVEAVIHTVFHIANNRLMFPDLEAFRDVANALRCVQAELMEPRIVQSTTGDLHLPHLHLRDRGFAIQMRQLENEGEELSPQSLEISDRERTLVQMIFEQGAKLILRRIDNLRDITIYDEQKIENTAEILKREIMDLADRLAGLKSDHRPDSIRLLNGKPGDSNG